MKTARRWPTGRIWLPIIAKVCLIEFWNSVILSLSIYIQTNKQTPWSESASELYRPSDRRLSAKWLPTFAERVPRGQRDGYLRPYSRFSRQELLLFYQVVPQLYSRGRVDPVPDPILFFSWKCRESNPGLRICSQELWPLDHNHRSGPVYIYFN
jgi:hypothetical protein